MSIKSQSADKIKRWCVQLLPYVLFIIYTSKFGSMETYLAMGAVLVGREYLTSQIALRFSFLSFSLSLFFFLLFRCSAAVCCYATASSKLSGSGPHSPPVPPPFPKKKKKNAEGRERERYFVHELRRAPCSNTLRIPHLNKAQYFNI